MGKKGTEIVDMDVKELITLLNKAFADEWLAYYQYWLGAKLVRGPLKDGVIPELEEHAAEELKHAGMLAERIIKLGGTPITKPEDWYKHTICGYAAPEDSSVKTILEQNLKGEVCAIAVYKKLADLTMGKDHVTYEMVVDILEDEVQHEEDIQNELEDFEALLKLTGK